MCYITYKAAYYSQKNNIEKSANSAYFSFLLLVAFIPSVIIAIKFGKLESVVFFTEHFPKRSFLGIIVHLLLFFSPTMIITSFLIKKSYLERLTLPEEEIKKNRRILWLIILLFILYLITKIIIVRV
jgi:uncharacterized membrane protein